LAGISTFTTDNSGNVTVHGLTVSPLTTAGILVNNSSGVLSSLTNVGGVQSTLMGFLGTGWSSSTTLFLRADGTWSAAGGSAAGSSTWVQYNSSGSFGANSGFTSDGSGNVTVASLTDSGLTSTYVVVAGTSGVLGGYSSFVCDGSGNVTATSFQADTGHFDTIVSHGGGGANAVTVGGVPIWQGLETGGNNISIGGLGLGSNVGGSGDVAVGFKALFSLTGGSGNTALGALAGNSQITYTNCTFVGSGADAVGTYTNSTALGYNASATASNQVVLGNSSVTLLTVPGYITAGILTNNTGGNFYSLSGNSSTLQGYLGSGTPSATTFLRGDGTWAVPAGGGTTTNSLTINSGGSGGASPQTFNGSSAITISYNTVGAQVAGNYATGSGTSTYVTYWTGTQSVGGNSAFTSDTSGNVAVNTLNKVTVTAPATSATLTLVTGSTLQTTGAFTLNLTTTAAATPTFPTGTYTLAQISAGQTFTGTNTFSSNPTFSAMSTAGIVTNNGSGILASLSNAVSVSSTLMGLLGTGTPSSSTYLRGDGTWSTPPGGSFSAWIVTTKSTTYTVSTSDQAVYFNGTSPTTFTMPASPTAGAPWFFKNIGTATLTLAASQGFFTGVSGNATFTMNPGDSVDMIYASGTYCIC
jgi:hypothetical protein